MKGLDIKRFGSSTLVAKGRGPRARPLGPLPSSQASMSDAEEQLHRRSDPPPVSAAAKAARKKSLQKSATDADMVAPNLRGALMKERTKGKVTMLKMMAGADSASKAAEAKALGLPDGDSLWRRILELQPVPPEEKPPVNLGVGSQVMLDAEISVMIGASVRHVTRGKGLVVAVDDKATEKDATKGWIHVSFPAEGDKVHRYQEHSWEKLTFLTGSKEVLGVDHPDTKDRMKNPWGIR